jgi:hypothetical protein
VACFRSAEYGPNFSSDEIGFEMNLRLGKEPVLAR